MAENERASEHYALTLEDGTRVPVAEDAITGMDLYDPGYCLVCGEQRGGCEPDAREYYCDVCETPTVYGAQELLLMGRIS
jgi:hypothetical protein